MHERLVLFKRDFSYENKNTEIHVTVFARGKSSRMENLHESPKRKRFRNPHQILMRKCFFEFTEARKTLKSCFAGQSTQHYKRSSSRKWVLSADGGAMSQKWYRSDSWRTTKTRNVSTSLAKSTCFSSSLIATKQKLHSARLVIHLSWGQHWTSNNNCREALQSLSLWIRCVVGARRSVMNTLGMPTTKLCTKSGWKGTESRLEENAQLSVQRFTSRRLQI